MAKRKSTPSFIHELPLRVDPRTARVLSVRFEAARNLYNACLRESLRRLDLMHESRAWRKARACKDKKERSALFRKAAAPFALDEYSLHAFAAESKNACWIGDHLDINTCQKIAGRAYQAVAEHLYGKRGRPRFKRKGRLDSVEGKDNSCGIRWRDGRVVWLGLDLTPIFDSKDKDGVEAHALSRPVKYLRLVRRTLRGEIVWSVQLIVEGRPLLKPRHVRKDGPCGLDIGPSTLALVGETEAALVAFADEVDPLGDRLRLIQRAMDRSLRATNPENYNADGTVKKGIRLHWRKSVRYRALQVQSAEVQRKLAAARKNAHGRLANRVLSIGVHVRTEKLSYRGFQRRWGKSVGRRAPGMFVAMMRRKAENAGGQLDEFPTRSTCFSQLCLCGVKEKKPLSQRWHDCSCGVGPVQRDLFSAFLARQWDNGTFDMRRAQAAWPGAKPLLDRAMSKLDETANGEARLASFGLGRRRSGSHGKDGSPHVKVRDAVGRKAESPEAMSGLPSKPPGFRHGVV